MIEKLNQLIEIMAAISETYYDENEFLDSGYPFNKSFDEVLYDVAEWRNAYAEQMSIANKAKEDLGMKIGGLNQ